MEIWKEIKGYEDYLISSKGKVKSLKNGKEKIMKLNKDKKGYLYVSLYKNNKSKRFAVHRLVAIAFLENPNQKPCIDHIDTNKSNNTIENLRWATIEENNNNEITKKKISEAHKKKNLSLETRKKMSEARSNKKNYMYGKHHTEETRKKMSEAKRGEKSPNAKKIFVYDLSYNLVKVFDTHRQCAEWIEEKNMCSFKTAREKLQSNKKYTIIDTDKLYHNYYFYSYKIEVDIND